MKGFASQLNGTSLDHFLTMAIFSNWISIHWPRTNTNSLGQFSAYLSLVSIRTMACLTLTWNSLVTSFFKHVTSSSPRRFVQVPNLPEPYFPPRNCTPIPLLDCSSHSLQQNPTPWSFLLYPIYEFMCHLGWVSPYPNRQVIHLSKDVGARPLFLINTKLIKFSVAPQSIRDLASMLLNFSGTCTLDFCDRVCRLDILVYSMEDSLFANGSTSITCMSKHGSSDTIESTSTP